MENVQVLIDDEAGRGVLAKDNPVHFLLHVEARLRFRLSSGRSQGSLVTSGEGQIENPAGFARPFRTDLVLPVDHREEFRETADRFRLPALREAWTVMWLSVSIVKVVIIVILGAALFAVVTSITPKCSKSKAIMRRIDDGEGLAMLCTSAGRKW
jgi:hypothetical protein